MFKKLFERAFTRSLPKNFFDLSYEYKTSMDMGQIIPHYFEEVVAGDRVKLGNEIVIRFQPLVAPVLHNIKVKTEYFYIPFRILSEDWETFYTGGKDGFDFENPTELPVWDDYLNTTPPKYSLWDYLGLPLVSPTSEDWCPIDMVRTAYNMIWNYYYRDETIDSETALDNNNILYCRWKKDYFTSALPFQQRGVAPAFPVSGSAKAVWDKDLPIISHDISTVNDYNSIFGNGHLGLGKSLHLMQYSGSTSNVLGFSDTLPPISARFAAVPRSGGNGVEGLQLGNSENHYGLNNNNVDVDNLVTFNIAELREAEQLQLFLELNARGGYRYEEFLLTHFGIAPSDARLQEPEYLGGSVSPLLVSEVLQTSESTDDSPQGNLAGRGIGATENYICKFTAPEPGLVIGLMRIVPDLNYCSQGIERFWLHKTAFDFFFPEFSHLSERPVLRGELFLGSDDDDNSEVFGYQQIYDEYRHRRSMVTGDMRDTFDYWHLARKFENQPELNSSFLEMKPSKRIFAVQDEPGFVVDVFNRAHLLRPIPKFGTPGFMRF